MVAAVAAGFAGLVPVAFEGEDAEAMADEFDGVAAVDAFVMMLLAGLLDKKAGDGAGIGTIGAENAFAE